MEPIKHECGIAMIRLLKSQEYYQKKYDTETYALDKLYLMMEKQHNRGQEGAGIASVSLQAAPGHEFMFREKAEGKDAITTIFANAYRDIDESNECCDGNIPFHGELFMGHLRYSTTGKRGLKYVHPFLRRNNWRAKNLCICGNFNMTNIDEVFKMLTTYGQSPRMLSDTYLMLDWLGHRLDREAERNFADAQAAGLTGSEITQYIDEHIDMARVLQSAMPVFDGGYAICGITGSGEFFCMRDPWGIRPAFYHADGEVVAVASERPVLQTTFDLDYEDIHEIQPGQALIVNSRGELHLQQILPPQKQASCSFERIYFSRGNDQDIHQERKQLGRMLRDRILRAIDNDVEHTVFSYIPNTAEVSFFGMIEGIREVFPVIRTEKVISKDIKLRTFITEGKTRNDLAAHVYDITYGSLKPYEDNLVVIDDSIVRGTTLKESILRILSRLHPKKIVMVSSGPQVRYPDYYGIDMANLSEFIAFRAAISLLIKKNKTDIIDHVYQQCKQQEKRGDKEWCNYVKEIYDAVDYDELCTQMAEMMRPEGVDVPIELIFQSIGGLHQACPNHTGDWYFSGDYPTLGGMKLVNKTFINYYEKEYNVPF
ncbi:MAG: amidophosphoribosyltransferase [Bacteroidales bacterium]|nr:amidophosphoribosyltransferase [Bacteroidales bacterium]